MISKEQEMCMVEWLSVAAAEIEAVFPTASAEAKLAAVIESNKSRNLLDSLKRIELSLDEIASGIRNHS
jgi:hypothetical protein